MSLTRLAEEEGAQHEGNVGSLFVKQQEKPINWHQVDNRFAFNLVK